MSHRYLVKLEKSMSSVITIWNKWQVIYQSFLDNADPRVADWPLMQGYTPTLLLSLCYLATVWGLMQIMKNHKPLEIRWLLIAYNTVLVALNFHICSEIFIGTWRRNYSYSCTPVTYSTDPEEMRIARAIWWYYVSKCIEFLDTIFFVLRKKNDQVSFLHVYHHATMFPLWWIGVKWVAGGQSFFGAMINSFVHVVMYSYYALAALGPAVQSYLWWKRYLTKFQLVQFVVGISHAAQSLVVGCNYPLWMQWALIFYGFTILALFINFYFRAYVQPRRAVAQSKSNGCASSNGHQKSNGHTQNGHMKTNAHESEVRHRSNGSAVTS